MYRQVAKVTSRHFSFSQYLETVGVEKTGLAGCVEKSMHIIEDLHKTFMPSESIMASADREEHNQ